MGEICEGSAGCKDTMWKEGVGGTAFLVGTRVEGTSGRRQGQQGQGQRWGQVCKFKEKIVKEDAEGRDGVWVLRLSSEGSTVISAREKEARRVHPGLVFTDLFVAM